MKQRILAILLAGVMILNDGSFVSMAVNPQAAAFTEAKDEEIFVPDETEEDEYSPDNETEPPKEEMPGNKAKPDDNEEPSAKEPVDTEPAESEEPDLDFTDAEETGPKLIYSDSGDTVTGYTPGTGAEAEEVIIPRENNGIEVVKINEDAFRDCKVITSVVLPDTIKEIGVSAFSGCTGLSKITIPKSVTNIGVHAFENSVTEIEFEDGMVKIPDNACNGASNLTVAHIPSTVTEIGASAFWCCRQLVTANLKGIASIGPNAFSDCEKLEQADLGDSLHTIGHSAFSGCTALSKVTVPKSVTDIGVYAFSGSVEEIEFEDGMVKIPDDACSNASNLTAVYIPSTVTEIGYYAFYNCSALKSITIPKGIISIGERCFGNSIEEVIFEDGITKIPDHACAYGDKLKTVQMPATVTEIGQRAFYQCSSLQKATILDHTIIGKEAFSSCSALEELTIGDHVTLGDYAFKDCGTLNVFKIGKDSGMGEQVFYGVFVEGQCGDNLAWKLGIGDKELVISGDGAMDEYASADEVPWYPFNAFIECLEFTGEITTIGSHAFQDCDGLSEAIIKDSVTQIGEEAFYSCDSLVYAEQPKNLEIMGNRAFGNCNNLEEIVFCGDAPSLGAGWISAAQPLIAKSQLTISHPEYAAGWTRVSQKLPYKDFVWRTYDNTKPSKDAVLLLDVSDSMSGNALEQLKKAASSFVNKVGGKRNNTRTAIVEYESEAKVAAGFSFNNRYQVRQIEKLASRGGTAYLKALNRAKELLEKSYTDYKTIVLFSDGEPTDSVEQVSKLAKELREEGYIIYTVGLFASEEHRKLLIDVAGKEENYFEASDIDKLQQAFEKLSENFGKSETTTCEMIRGGKRFDLLKEEQVLCKNSDELLSIIVKAGTKYKDVGKIVLKQNGNPVLENTTGEFKDIKADLFETGGNFFVELYDTAGLPIDGQRLKITVLIQKEYTITYMMNDGTDTVYRTEKHISGKDVVEPEKPVRDGYLFKGWYSCTSCKSNPVFSDRNKINRMKWDCDQTLHACWVSKSTLDLKREAFSFTNHERYFCTPYWLVDEETYYIEIRDADEKRLYELYPEESDSGARIKEYRNTPWNGSCFGMSSAVCLSKEEMLDISNFDSSITDIGEASLVMNKKGEEPGAVESMINYYLLRQMAGKIYDIEQKAFNKLSESDRLETIINKMKTSNGVIVITVDLFEETRLSFIGIKRLIGGHAVVAYDFQEDGNTYTFQIYDCSMGNETSYPVTITKDESGSYSAECDSWKQAWGACDIIFKAAYTADNLAEEPLLTEPASSKVHVDTSGGMPTYYLDTSYADFTVSNGTETAKIVDGQLKEGGLQVECYGQVNESGTLADYLFGLPTLTADAVYTITPENGVDTYHTMMHYRDSANGFLVSEKAKQPGIVTVSPAGKITAEYKEAVFHISHASTNKMKTPWYYIGVEGENTGIVLEPQEDGTNVLTTSQESQKVDIQVEADFNCLEAHAIAVDQGGVRITAGQGNHCIIQKGSEELFNKPFGYSVIFDSQCGTSVNTLVNVLQGTLIEEPNDPRRSGYVFEGWFKEESCENLWDFAADTVTGDTVLYAGWSVNPNYFLSVTFKMPEEEDQYIYVPRGSRLERSDCPDLPQIWEQNWYTDSKYTKAWDFENHKVVKDIVLYAKGVGARYTVTFQTDPESEARTKKAYEGTCIARPDDPKKEGCIFTGWFKDSACSEEWDFSKDVVTGNITLYAGWQETVYTVTFDVQKEGIAPERYPAYTDVKLGDKIQEPETPQDTYYAFTGWYKEAKCENRWDFQSDTVRENITLYGGWEEIFYAVTFDLQGHGAPLKEYENYKAVKPMGLIEEPPAPSATGYVFTGWYKDASCLFLWDFGKDIVQNDVTLYAGWTVDEDFGGVLPDDDVLGRPREGIWVAGVKDYTYTGKAVRPPVRVYDGETRLRAGRDYTVSYKNNVKAADADAGKKVPTVVVKAKGNYAGTFTATFTIKKAVLTPGNLAASEVYPAGKAYTPVVMLGSNVLKAKKDYTLAYFKKDKTKLSKRPTKEGEYFMQVAAKGNNCEGEFSVAYTVAKDGSASIGKGKATVDNIRYGDEEKPKTTLKVGNQPLQVEKDYKVEFPDRDKAGTGTAVFVGSGKYMGILKKNFKIQPVTITEKDITVSETAAYEKGGARPEVTVRGVGGVKLAEGVDYTLSYTNNKKLGQAAVTVKGKGNYTGRESKPFQVEPKDLSAPGVQIFVSDTVAGRKPVVTVFDTNGKKLSPGSDYGVTAGEGSVSITGGKNGLYTVSDKIIKSYRQLEKDKVITSVSLNKDADGFPQNFSYTGGKVELKNDWLKVKAGSTFLTSQDFEIHYVANVQAGTATVVVQGTGAYGGCKVLNYKIKAQSVPKEAGWFSSLPD